jgi:NitT/TauT family transport system substrate-binding protein
MKRATFALLAGGFAGAAATRAVRGESLATIRFGTAAVESYALAIYAAERGAFRAAGLDVQVTTMSGGGAVLAAVAGGALDLACANLGAQANAHIRGVPIAMIAPGGLYTSASPTTVLAVARTSTIRSAKDLDGKTIGVSTLKDLQQASVMKWADANGGDSATLRFLEIPVPEMAPALTAARIDAATLLEPSLTYDQGEVRVLGKCYDAIAPTLMITSHFGTAGYLAKDAGPARTFAAVLRQTATWANANPAESSAILARVTKIPASVVAQMHRVTFAETLDVATMQPVIDASAHYTFLPRSFPIAEMFWAGRNQA